MHIHSRSQPIVTASRSHSLLLQFTAWVLLSGFFVAIMLGLPAFAEGKSAAQEKVNIADELDKIRSALESDTEDEESLKAWSRKINNLKISIATCSNEVKNELKKATDDLATLGEKTEDEVKEIAAKRKALAKDIAVIEQRSANCRLLSLTAEELLEQINSRQKVMVSARLFSKGPNLWDLVIRNWTKPAEWLAAIKNALKTNSGIDKLTTAERVAIALAFAIGLFLSALYRSKWRAELARKPIRKSFGSQFSLALSSTISHYFIHLVGSVSLAFTVYMVTRDLHPIPFIGVVSYGLPVYFALVVLIRVFLVPRGPAQRFLDIEESVARSLARRLRVLALLSFLGYLLFATLLVQSLPEPAVQLARAIFFAFLVLNLIWVFWLIGRIQWFSSIRFLRFGLSVVLIAILIEEWLGYRNLALASFRVLFGTAMAFGLMTLINRILRESYDGLESGRYRWQKRVRAKLGLKGSDPVPGLVWVRALTAIVLWGGFLLLTLRILGMSETAMQSINLYLVDGFDIGSVHIVPMRFLFALAAFVLLVTIGQWFSTRLDRNWLNKTRMERGAREAMVTISGYLGIAIALLVGLGIAGLNFGNLAIIAGALSVGIGFGLQNVVNNFVSGLILLFERPVKTGDWVVVGSTEGFVRRIRIRSTQIQTFDQADVIVPNSELISNQVTNWMLYDTRGRIRVPVGVAYGSDTQMVKDILLGLVQDHEKIITDIPNLQPKVLFLSFGDSALNFELRCFIRNIDTKLDVISDLNFAIDAAFREHGIQIPFPQRDLHLKLPSAKPSKDEGAADSPEDSQKND